MRDDMRIYNYYEDDTLISRMTQAKNYFDDKFKNIHADVDMSELNDKLDNIHVDVDMSELNDKLDIMKDDIIDAIDDSKPCLCHLATKEDVCKAKCAVVDKIEESKREIIHEIDDKFVNLNDLIK